MKFTYFVGHHFPVLKHCNRIKTQGFSIIQFLNFEWDIFEKEEVAMENNWFSILKCAIKCSMTVNCGGSTYHQDSGVCEIGKVIIIFLKRESSGLRAFHRVNNFSLSNHN